MYWSFTENMYKRAEFSLQQTHFIQNFLLQFHMKMNIKQYHLNK